MTRDPAASTHGCQDTVATVAPWFPGLADPFPGEYRLVRKLGQGAFGEVWLADDLSPLARPVALKFLRVSGRGADRALDVLRNEARILGSVRHPNIVPVHAWRQASDPPAPCLVLHYVNGGALDALVRREGPLPWPRAARYVADVADGLAVLHRQGIIHRDVKPANVLLDLATDAALLTDFGVAALLAEPGTVAGTLPYMAPEAFGGRVAAALDVYALAASLFWLLTGQPPFDGADEYELVRAARRGLPSPDGRLAGVPAGLERLIRAGLAPVAERPALADFVAELRAVLNALLADGLTMPGGGLRVTVSRWAGDNWERVASTDGGDAVPRVEVRTGDRVRVEAAADQPGFLTVFNLGPTGNLNLLYPETPESTVAAWAANEALQLRDVEMAPPAGAERLCVVWTRLPLSVRLDELRSLADTATGLHPAYETTGDMLRVGQSLQALSANDRQVVVLALVHQ